MLQRSKNHIQGIAMFSLIALYFAYRRDVVTAERHMDALTPAAAPVAQDARPVVLDTPLPLAA
jgi:hypothetical protein